MKRSAGDEDGPDQKHLASRSQQDGQAHRSATPLRTNYPQVPPSVLFSEVWELQRIRDSSTKTIWSGTFEIPNGPHSNDQRQDVDIISGKIHFTRRINTDNWPKQLKMTTISLDDFWKLESLDVRTLSACIFTVDRDCNKMSHRAFIQYSSRPHYGCVILEYTSSAIQVMFLEYGLLQGEMFTIGCIMKYSNNDCTVKILTDVGILSHATTYNRLSKDNLTLKDRLKQKFKEVSSLERELKQKDKEIEKLVISNEEERKNQLRIIEEISQENNALMMERDQNLMKIDTQKREIEKLKNETEMMRTRCSELENQVLPKKAILGKLKKELQCGFCLRTIKRAITIECGHTFCNKCLDKSLDHNITEEPLCPMCRGRIQEHTLRPTVAVDNCAGILKDDDSSSVSSQSSSGSLMD